LFYKKRRNAAGRENITRRISFAAGPLISSNTICEPAAVIGRDWCPESDLIKLLKHNFKMFSAAKEYIGKGIFGARVIF
jgi:hypothetical protein